MKNNWWRWLIAAGLIGVFVTYCSNEREKNKRQSAISSAKYDADEAKENQRYINGAFISKEKQISLSETIKTVVIPGKFGDMTDTVCLIYTHQEFKQSSMICPDADRDRLEDGSAE